MRRRHSPREVALLERWRRLNRFGGEKPVSRKHHPLDCGNPRCGVCHAHKRFGHEETRQEHRERLDWHLQQPDA